MSLLEQAQIEALTHARDPYLWVDEVVELAEDQIHTRKHLKSSDPLFSGHFIDLPVFPGALQCECAFQATAILLGHSEPSPPETVPVIARVRQVKFRQMVRPECRLDVHVQVTDRVGRGIFLKAYLSVGDIKVCELEFVATEAARPEVASLAAK